MNEKLKKILTGIASETFEGLAFMFGFPEDDASAVSNEDMIFAQVDFEGAFSGRVVLAVSRSPVEELTANMLGLEDEETDVSPEDQADALRETLNVICGNLLPAIGGKDTVFDIHSPEILPDATSIGSMPEAGLVTTARLSLEDEPCQLWLYVNEKNPEALFKFGD